MVQRVPLLVFISYSHRDEEWRRQLEIHLGSLLKEERISIWHSRKIRPGDDWSEEISDHLATADLILPLISADFLTSGYCHAIEMRRALERHAAGEARIVPVVMRPCDWHGTPLARLQALPRDSLAVTSRSDVDAGILGDRGPPWLTKNRSSSSRAGLRRGTSGGRTWSSSRC